ncbi:sulfate permease [Trichodelitschia bisporula]|uniref:Sulfate permease n=1 Tax=Trichodelitschia bisporula TaxID=703511 RepID=A0A6G1I6X6_9PEZI|nr:sulfate permease [Trichodelitschia bisporula]
MATTKDKVGRGLAKALGIKVDEYSGDPLTRGESVFSVNTADTYVEEEPHTGEWLWEQVPKPKDIKNYIWSLFPFLHWITRYNFQWLRGDLVAGITVGAVVVPQSMAYAKLAQLSPEFGLYSSFMGVLVYWFFATSKDITIGPVAVMSTITGNVVLHAHKTIPDVEGYHVASALAIICGGIITFLGLARLGWIVEFISLAAISAFMTGSAISIAAGQVPAMMGITGFNTRDATYKVIINTLKGLPRTNLNAAIGLTALFLLYLIRSLCSFGAKKYPNKRQLFFFLSTLRTAFVILLYILISYLMNRHHRKKPVISILGKVPRGFQHAGAPLVNARVIKAIITDLPASVIVLLIEHISISKSFGRINNYTINPSQELIAIGVTNLLGPFLGGYPATGSFSRTAIKSKAGVRTPFAGVITAVVVLLAIYALPAMFFYIPNAGLAAVIIHAVGDLITPPSVVYKFWRISPLEVPIFFAGVIVTVFSSIENGIYTTICASFALFIFRLFKAQGRFLGRVKIHSVTGGRGDADDLKGADYGSLHGSGGYGGGNGGGNGGDSGTGPAHDILDDHRAVRNAFLPIDHDDGSNPALELETPYPGVFIYRFSEGFVYPNASHYLDALVSHIFANTRRTNPATYGRLGDRPWNDPGPRRGKAPKIDEHKPTLKAVILDFSSVNNVDITSVQTLIDVRNQLDRYASPDQVEWHFASLNNRWTKRALASAGFGYPSHRHAVGDFQRWKPIYSVAEIGGFDSAANDAEWHANRDELRHGSIIPPGDLESTAGGEGPEKGAGVHVRRQAKRVVVQGINRPLFHVDLTAALQSAVRNAEARRAAGESTPQLKEED